MNEHTKQMLEAVKEFQNEEYTMTEAEAAALQDTSKNRPTIQPKQLPSWDHQLTSQLTNNGLTWEQARYVVGIIAEQRQTAYLQGYQRGYNNGHKDATTKR